MDGWMDRWIVNGAYKNLCSVNGCLPSHGFSHHFHLGRELPLQDFDAFGTHDCIRLVGNAVQGGRVETDCVCFYECLV